MLTNFHTHTTFCDGKATAEDMVLSALETGFCSLGFSGHGYTPYDPRYCMKDTEGYIAEVKRLKEKYKNDIEIYLGIEEDSRSPQCRRDFDYVIGSCHYCESGGILTPIDSSYAYFMTGLNAYGGNKIRYAENYFSHFCDYILKRKPDIIGHFDLITKFDEKYGKLFLDDKEYQAVAEKYTKIALKAESIFEVNTGAITRNLRSTPYPAENLLRIILKEGGKITLSSDSHSPDTLCGMFEQTKLWLKEIGFRQYYALIGGAFTAVDL